jgi:MFS family permease
MLGVPLGLVAGGVLSDLFGIAATFGISMLALAVAVASAWALLPDLTAPLGRERLLDTLRGLGNRGLAAIGALSFAAFFAAHGVVMTMLPLLVHDRKISVAHLGDKGTGAVFMGWLVVVLAAGSPLAGNLGDRRRAHGRVAAAGLAILVPGLVLTGVAQASLPLAAAVTLVGLGASALGPSLLALIGGFAAGGDQAAAIGFVQFCGDLGSMLGPLIGTLVVGRDLGRPYLVSGAIVACFLPIAAWLIRRERAAGARPLTLASSSTDVDQPQPS